MYIYKVIFSRLQDNYLVIKLIEGSDIQQVDHLGFLQLIIDNQGNQTGQYIQTIQIFFPGQRFQAIDCQKQMFNYFAPQLNGQKVTQIFNTKRLNNSVLIKFVEEQILQRQK